MAVDDVSAPPGIQVVQPAATVEAQPPATNPALQLADALRESSPEIDNGLNNIAGHLQRVQSLKAQTDAMRTSGKAFADAVRDGDILPTQNPWYVKAYREAAGAVFTRNQAAEKLADSNNWPERNDPAAYQARLTQELGGIAQAHGMQDVDSQLGFQETIKPLLDGALARNQEYNAQRIQQENVQNTTSLATSTIQDTLKADPNATPEEVFQNLETAHNIWTKVQGGDESQWRLIVKQAVVGAAAVSNRSDIVDFLKAPYMGGQPIANQADETGKPVGLELDSDKFWIDRGIESTLNAAYKAHQAQIAGEGAKLDAAANAAYGNDWGLGKVDQSTFTQWALGQGYSGEAVTWALGQRGEAIRQAAGYGGSQQALWSSDPANQRTIIQLNREAVTQGLTPHVFSMLDSLVGKVPTSDLMQFVDRAQQQSHFQIQLSHEDTNSARSNAIAAGSLALQRHAMAVDSGKQAQNEMLDILRRQGYGDIDKLSPKDQKEFDTVVTAAAGAQTDPSAALTQGREAAGQWAENYRRKHPLPGSTAMGLQVGSAILNNPNRP